MELYQVKATAEGQTLVVGYGKTYYMALKDCESQFDIVSDLNRDDFVMFVRAPDSNKVYKLTYAQAKTFNF